MLGRVMQVVVDVVGTIRDVVVVGDRAIGGSAASGSARSRSGRGLLLRRRRLLLRDRRRPLRFH